MTETLKLLAVFAHPDDETLGMGGTLVKYVHEGIETYLVTATRGERGWQGAEKNNPGLAALGKIREEELRCACKTLGLKELNFLDCIDGDVDQADPRHIVPKIVAHIRRIQPQVVVTFPPDGIYGHPDHIAMSQFTSAALVHAGDPSYREANGAAHRVSKFYFQVAPQDEIDRYQAVFGELKMNIDGVEREAFGWKDWAITTRVDSQKYSKVVWQAVQCHHSQLPGYRALAELTEDQHRVLWGTQCFYRAYSTVNGGRKLETDLFEGLR